MKMGEFINAMRSYKISNTISDQGNGSKTMKSIKPEIGPGLGSTLDKNRGRIFPKFNISKSQSFDELFSFEPILVVSKKLKLKKMTKLTLLPNEHLKSFWDALWFDMWIQKVKSHTPLSRT